MSPSVHGNVGSKIMTGNPIAIRCKFSSVQFSSYGKVALLSLVDCTASGKP